PVKGVGELGAGEPHAQFDGGAAGNGSASASPRQLPTQPRPISQHREGARVTHPQFLQWSFQHAREIVPTARISRGTGAVAALTENLQPLAELPVVPPGGAATTVAAVLATTYTDGFLVLH